MCERRKETKPEEIRGKITKIKLGKTAVMELFEIPDDYVPPGKPEHPDIILPDACVPPDKPDEPNQEHPDRD